MNTLFGLSHSWSLLLITAVAVTGLIVLIARFKLNSFMALALASLFVGLCAGLGLPELVKAFQEGMGKVLGDIAMVVGLGTVLGKMLAESGGAERIATTLVQAFGQRWTHWTMMLIAFIVGIPVFFAVGLVLLIPIAVTVARETKTPLLRLGLPLVAGLSVVHGLVPPHPGPIAAIGFLQGAAGHVDVGKVILYSLLVGFPTAIIAGPLLGTLLARRVRVETTGGWNEQLKPSGEQKSRPAFGLAVFTILLPILLMLLATVADVTLPKENAVRQWIDFVGSPMVAMLVAVLFSFWSFGFGRGFNKEQVLKFTNDCLAPVAGILLVVGAGGGFNKVLVASGVGEAIANLAKGTHLSPLLLGWLVAALIRVATGSATVAISTAAGILAPIVTQTPGLNVELLVVAMGAGSLLLSHVNDGGFWFVKEYLNLTVTQTLQTWTVMVTIIAVVALLLVLLLGLAL